MRGVHPWERGPSTWFCRRRMWSALGSVSRDGTHPPPPRAVIGWGAPRTVSTASAARSERMAALHPHTSLTCKYANNCRRLPRAESDGVWSYFWKPILGFQAGIHRPPHQNYWFIRVALNVFSHAVWPTIQLPLLQEIIIIVIIPNWALYSFLSLLQGQ